MARSSRIGCPLQRTLVVLLLLSLYSSAATGDPPQDAPLPPPRAVPPAQTPVYVIEPPLFLRPNRYDVWQYRAVDRYGRFRPLVIASPHGPYYLLTGKPYPYALLHSLNWMPYIAH